MDTLKKFAAMEKIVHELEDLRNSQQAIIQKLGKIEVDNMDLGDKRLDTELPDMHQRISDNLDAIAGILEYFAGNTDKFHDTNNVEQLKEEKAIREAAGNEE
ncbi:hypothetical protein [Mucilaginibacter arboris]|uniref:Uncharacterized protein n=1 Tax=Mucilaginibacter arboris TaxID=2682090 RepID=A0A7K1SYL0_9SPHI|nr:hypothetical protein [Mucilaginibacter arboris]MVN22416.1 hypothetical protein [Mucilaginibacter arboris]